MSLKSMNMIMILIRAGWSYFLSAFETVASLVSVVVAVFLVVAKSAIYFHQTHCSDQIIVFLPKIEIWIFSTGEPQTEIDKKKSEK